MSSVRQVATYTVPPNVSLRIFEEQSSTSSISSLLIAEPLLDWQRDEKGRPLINAVSRVQGGGAVFELRLIISTLESQQAAQRAVSADEDLQKLKLITQIDSVNLALAKGNMGELLEFTGGEMYPSRNENVVLVDFESSSLTANEEDVEKVRSILRLVELICKASVNGHELPPISLDFSTIAPPSTSSPSSSPSGPAAAVNEIDAVASNPPYRPLLLPHSPRVSHLPVQTVYRLAWTPSGNLVATTNGPLFLILKSNGEYVRQINSGPGLQELINTQGVAVSDDGHIFISDSQTHRITVYTEDGRLIRSFGELGSGTTQFKNPSSMAISKRTGNLFVTDCGNRRIQVFDREGNFLSFFGSAGTEPGQLNAPHGIDIDDDDNVFVAENLGNRVSVFTSHGEFLRCFCSVGTAPGQLKYPQQLYIDRPSGRILIAEFNNNRFQIFDRNGIVEHTIATGFQVLSILVDTAGKVIVGGFRTSSLHFYDN